MLLRAFRSLAPLLLASLSLAGCGSNAPASLVPGAVPDRHASSSNPLQSGLIVIPQKASGIVDFYPVHGPLKYQLYGSLTGLDQIGGVAVDAAHDVYVESYTGSNPPSMLEFAPNAPLLGNVAPMRTIAGPATTLNNSGDIAVDAQGNLYVPDRSANIVAVFNSTESGNVAPLRLIKGPKTRLVSPDAVAIDSHGRLYVANGINTVEVFSPNANGNVAPIRTLKVGKSGLYDICFDLHDNLYVAVAGTFQVYEYAPGAHGAAAPIRKLGGSKLGDPDSVAVDAKGRIIVSVINAASASFVKIYGPNASGNASAFRGIGVSAWAFQIAVVP